MTDAGEPLPSGDTASQDEASLRSIEQDLDHVDEALAALDSGDLDAAEALAAGLDSPGAQVPDDSPGMPVPDDGQRDGDER